MKTRCVTSPLLVLLIGILLSVLSGCSILPSLSPPPSEEAAATALELHLGSALPDDVVLTWDPAAVAVECAEVSVTEDGPEFPRTVTVTVQLRRP